MPADYHAPLVVYGHVSRHPSPGGARVCVGKEWYRFSSSFFLPEEDRLEGGGGVEAQGRSQQQRTT